VKALLYVRAPNAFGLVVPCLGSLGNTANAQGDNSAMEIVNQQDERWENGNESCGEFEGHEKVY